MNEDHDEAEGGMLSDEEVQKMDEKFVEAALDKLMFRFDAVQIFVTRQEPDQRTMGFCTGKGNFYSRWGVVNEWLSRGGQDDAPPESPEDEQE